MSEFDPAVRAGKKTRVSRIGRAGVALTALAGLTAGCVSSDGGPATPVINGTMSAPNCAAAPHLNSPSAGMLTPGITAEQRAKIEALVREEQDKICQKAYSLAGSVLDAYQKDIQPDKKHPSTGNNKSNLYYYSAEADPDRGEFTIRQEFQYDIDGTSVVFALDASKKLPDLTQLQAVYVTKNPTPDIRTTSHIVSQPINMADFSVQDNLGWQVNSTRTDVTGKDAWPVADSFNLETAHTRDELETVKSQVDDLLNNIY